MKIFRFLHPSDLGGGADSSLCPPTDCDAPLVTLPDTAMLKLKTPFFIPDFATDRCSLQLCLCVRINRLGRSIAERFASRYYAPEETTLAVHFVATGLLEQLIGARQPWELAVGFDNAVAVGRPIGMELAASAGSPLPAGLHLSHENRHFEVPDFLLADMLREVDRKIERISSFYTLRQGDLLLLPFRQPFHDVVLNETVRLTLGNQELLSFHVK